jgi:hypothetical protein
LTRTIFDVRFEIDWKVVVFEPFRAVGRWTPDDFPAGL